jgi:hypothetical protein
MALPHIVAEQAFSEDFYFSVETRAFERREIIQ